MVIPLPQMIIFVLTDIYTFGLGIVKINFASALDFLYICASRTYTDTLRQNQSKLCFCSQLLVYLQVVKNENLLIWKIMK